ncbi:MAG: hypothetical protein AAF632_04415 [Bacteroidota bacterium]
MKKFFFTLLLLIYSLNSFSFGLGDWRNTTPGGNTIDYPGGYIHLWVEESNEHVAGLKKWYFYKKYIVGSYERSGYFILNEETAQLDTFNVKSEWINAIKSKKIKPKVWTRWYSDAFINSWDDFLFFLTFGFLVSWPMIIGLSILTYKGIKKVREKPYNLTTLTAIGAWIIVILWNILGIFPQSI